ncbi:hypothetical protein L1987_33069 [Smallanthus sonchifolius]|uniref:Uncharacterized protein n=1 Tax=Smallanthus sonchifolius TaxID=185202 RepID=A0ACB9HR80_9ASTR|nr:hypothetical protein L1987_33069 [Smallanthus sonchifolius]
MCWKEFSVIHSYSNLSCDHIEVLKALDKGKYVPPSSTCHHESTEPDARDTEIKEFKEKVEILEAQVEWLQGKIHVLKENGSVHQAIIDKQQSDILLNKNAAETCHNLDLTDDRDHDNDPNASDGEVSFETIQDPVIEDQDPRISKPTSPSTTVPDSAPT